MKSMFFFLSLRSKRKEVMNGQACSSEHAKNVVYLVGSLSTQTRPAAAHSKTDLTLDTCWSLLFDPFCVSFNDGVAFYQAPDETGSLKLINLLQCCIFILFCFFTFMFLFFIEQMFKLRKKCISRNVIVNIVCSVLANYKVLNHYKC